MYQVKSEKLRERERQKAEGKSPSSHGFQEVTAPAAATDGRVASPAVAAAAAVLGRLASPEEIKNWQNEKLTIRKWQFTIERGAGREVNPPMCELGS